MLRTDTAEQTDENFGREVRRVFSEQGGSAELTARCDTVSAWHGGNDLPFLWPIHARHRGMLFGLLDLLNIQPSTRDHTLSRAIEVMRAHRHTHTNELARFIEPRVRAAPLARLRAAAAWGADVS